MLPQAMPGLTLSCTSIESFSELPSQIRYARSANPASPRVYDPIGIHIITMTLREQAARPEQNMTSIVGRDFSAQAHWRPFLDGPFRTFGGYQAR